MAAIRRGNLGCFLTNLSNYFTKSAYNFRRNQRRVFHCSSLLYGSGQEIKMPSLSPTMVEGKIVKWLKREGDILSPGDVLCDIETDKAVVSLEVEEEGILAKILIPENTSNVKVGSLIAVSVPEGEDWKKVDIQSKKAAVSDFDCSSSSSSSSSLSSSSSSFSSSSSSERDDEDIEGKYGHGPSSSILINMPSLSPTMTAGTIIKWLKKEGDTIAVGDVLCDIQTDKAVMSLESEEEGILAKILVPDDSKDVKVGTLIAVLVPEGEDWKNVVIKKSETTKKQLSTQHQPLLGEPSTAPDVRIKTFGPAVKAMLANYQLDPGLIKGSGKNNRLLKEDVLKYVEDNKLQRKPPKTVSGPGPSKTEPGRQLKSTLISGSEYTDIELTTIRKVIAKRLIQSKVEIPHSYTAVKCEVNNLIKEKNALNSEGIRVSINDLLTKATATALQIYPKANAVCINNEVKLSRNIDICIAVATDAGLYTPIIKSTNLKSVTTISKEIKELAEKAKEKILKPEEFQGGTFTISNLGMFGITHFSAIINPPQCGIIAIGGAIQSLDSDLNLKSHIVLNLSYDRRALEEEEAAEFMSTLKYVIENPKLIVSDVNQKALKMGL